MSTQHTEDRRAETPNEPNRRIEVDVMVHFSGFWPWGAMPYPLFIGGNGNAYASAYSHAGNGSGGPYVGEPPLAPYYGGYGRRPRLFGPIVTPLWVDDLIGGLVVLLAAVLAAAIVALVAFGVIKAYDTWLGGESAKAQPVGIADVLRSEHFPSNYHTLCGVTNVAGGTAYKLKLNRGGGCQRTIETTLPVEKIALVHNRSITRPNATFVFNRHSLSGDDVSRIKTTALGDQVKVDLRHVVVRLTLKVYKRLRGLPST